MTPVARCESALTEIRQYLIENQIAPTDVSTITLLLNHSSTLSGIYDELAVLSDRQLAELLQQLVSTRSYWSPKDAVAMRDSRAQLSQLNESIVDTANTLAGLLDEREQLQNTQPFTTQTHYHIAQVIQAASQDNYHFKFYVANGLDALAAQFDLKYWPSLGSVLREIADNAATAEIEATDIRTGAAIQSSRASKADFVRSILIMIEDIIATPDLGFPQGFKLTDAAIADFVNVSLQLAVEEIVDSTYIKNVRHRAIKSSDT